MRTVLPSMLVALLLATLAACGGDLLDEDAIDATVAAEGLEVVSLAFNDVTLRISSAERFTVVDRGGEVLDQGLTLEQLQAAYPDLARRLDRATASGTPRARAGALDATLYPDDL